LVIAAFDASPEASALISAYCTWIAPAFFFNGILFVANAAFNNMNAAFLATLFNFSRALLGTIPLVFLLSGILGPVGVLIGELGGAVVFGTLALTVALYRVPSPTPIGNNEHTAHAVDEQNPLHQDTTACQWSYCSGKSAIGQQVVETSETYPPAAEAVLVEDASEVRR